MSKASTLASEAPSAPLTGVWHPPGSSRSVAAELTFDDKGNAVVRAAGEILATGPLDRLAISVRVGSIPRRIVFPDASQFTTDDNDAVDALPIAKLRRSGLIHDLERFRGRLAVFAAVIFCFCFLIYRYAVPALVELAVAVTPPVVPQLLSAGTLATLDQTVFAASELPEQRRAAIETAFRSMAGLTERGAGGFVINFRKGGSIGPNAFALPDGNIILTDELVELAGNDEAILGVLAHEIGHVEHHHTLRQLYRAGGVTALIMLIGGDIGSGVEDILMQGSALVSLSYSRGQESDADRYSVEFMRRAGHDPAALVQFLDLMFQKFGDGGPLNMLSTHPATPARIEAIRAYSREGAGKD